MMMRVRCCTSASLPRVALVGTSVHDGDMSSLWSIRSRNSLLSIASSESVLSIGSAGSALSIGSAGSFASVGSLASSVSVLSAMSSRSRCSLFSAQSAGAALGWRQRGPHALRFAAVAAAGTVAVGLTWWGLGRAAAGAG
jgi:hypothetical protein